MINNSETMTEQQATDSDVPTTDDGDGGDDIAEPREVAEWLLERICNEMVSNDRGGADFAEHITDELYEDHPHVEIDVDYRNGHLRGVTVPDSAA